MGNVIFVTTTLPRLRPIDIGKPRMRGWLHTYAFGVAILCGIVLNSVAATRPGWAPLVACVVYSVTICALFGTSALYHRRVWSPHGYSVMKRLDHSMIYLFIAGTYTPFGLLLLPGRSGTTLLTIVWSGAITGIAVKMTWPAGPRLISAGLYIALGWVAVAVLPQLKERGGPVVFALLLTGGLAYSGGAVCYALRRPNPWPRVFGHHELFHACTLVAATCHHIAIYLALFA